MGSPVLKEIVQIMHSIAFSFCAWLALWLALPSSDFLFAEVPHAGGYKEFGVEIQIVL